jgi:hypothetical protein
MWSAGGGYRAARQRDAHRERRRVHLRPERLQFSKPVASLRCGAQNFFDDHRSRHASPARAEDGFGHRDVVVGEHRHHLAL